MRVLFLSTSPCLPQLVGGAQWSVHYFAQGLRERGHEVKVLAALRNGGWLGFRNKVTRALTKTACPVDRAMGYPTARGWDLSRGLRAAAASDRPDVLLVVGIGSQPVPLAQEALSLGIPVVYLVMDVMFDSHGGPLSALAPARFVANSEFTARRLADRYGCASTVIRPPINTARCQVAGTGRKVVMVNPQQSKGGLVALALAEARPDIPFVFYEAWSGDISAIRQKADSLPNVEWRGPVLDPRKVYEEARILLAPSQAEEAWGMVASEAQCSGIPVLGSDIGGLAESIGDGGIRLAPDAAPGEWLRALDLLWNEPQRWSEYSAAARRRAQRADIQIGAQVAALDQVIRDTVAPAPRQAVA